MNEYCKKCKYLRVKKEGFFCNKYKEFLEVMVKPIRDTHCVIEREF